MKVAFVHEWLTTPAGSEKVLEEAVSLYPGAPVYTLVYDPETIRRPAFAGREVHASFLQKLPGAARRYRMFLPLMPLAVEQFDLRGYDVVLSSSHAVAKGVLTRADQLHVSYVHTPPRYAWDLYLEHLSAGSGLIPGARGVVTRLMMHHLRLWDVAAANRVDVFLANSKYVARRIRKVYRRRAQVVYPPVDVERFRPDQPRDDFYLVLSRLVSYKRVDLVVEAARRLDRPLVVIGDGPERAAIERLAGPNTRLLGRVPDAVVQDHLERCRALVVAADEDFGIATVEALSAGAPVVAYGRGGSAEIVEDGVSGVLFQDQTLTGLEAAIIDFERRRGTLSPLAARARAECFGVDRFRASLGRAVERAWEGFRADE